MASKLRVKVWEVKNRLPVLKKSTKGFKFMYTTLDEIEEALKPLCEEYNIGYANELDVVNGKNVLTTSVFDLESDEFEVSTIQIDEGVVLAGMNGYQSLGSAITYFRRYNLTTLFGINTDADVDSVLPTAKKPSKDWVKQTKTLIAEGKNTRQQLEGWFGSNRSIMTPEQRKEVIELIQNVK